VIRSSGVAAMNQGVGQRPSGSIHCPGIQRTAASRGHWRFRPRRPDEPWRGLSLGGPAAAARPAGPPGGGPAFQGGRGVHSQHDQHQAFGSVGIGPRLTVTAPVLCHFCSSNGDSFYHRDLRPCVIAAARGAVSLGTAEQVKQGRDSPRHQAAEAVQWNIQFQDCPGRSAAYLEFRMAPGRVIQNASPMANFIIQIQNRIRGCDVF